jgi:CBS domain-containing protein
MEQALQSSARMKVSELMTTDPACCKGATPLPEVAAMMVEHDCGLIPVCDDEGRPVGTITDRDIACRVVATGRDPRTLTAADCMTKASVTVEGDSSAERANEMMAEHQIRRLLVTDGGGKLCGIVAQADLARRSEVMAGELVARVSAPATEPSAVY